jgi:hypothetical protein
MRRPQQEIDAEVERLRDLEARSAGYDEREALREARATLTMSMTPGQVESLHRSRHGTNGEYQGAMAAANWAAGLTETRPSDALT